MASGYVAANGKDLDDIFGFRVTPKTHNVQYYVDGVDISNRYEKLEGPPITGPTGFEWHGQDLNEIFGKLELPVAYRFLSPGTDAILPTTFPSALWSGDYDIKQPPPPVMLVFLTGRNNVAYAYPGGISTLGLNPSQQFVFTWIDQVILSVDVTPTIDQLWDSLDPEAVPVSGETGMDATGTNSIGTALPGQPLQNTVQITAQIDQANVSLQSFLDDIVSQGGFVRGFDADGNLAADASFSSVTDFWQVSTDTMKTLGFYTGLNLVAPFPLFLSLSGSSSWCQAAGEDATCAGNASFGPTVFDLTDSFPIIGEGNGHSGSPPAWCDQLIVSPPTAVIEQVIGG